MEYCGIKTHDGYLDFLRRESAKGNFYIDWSICESDVLILQELKAIYRDSGIEGANIQIDSSGGDMGAYYTFKDLAVETAKAINFCHSCGLYLFMLAEHRVCYPHTQFMYHPVLGGRSSQSPGQNRQKAEILDIENNAIADLMALKTKKNKEWWLEKLKTDYYFLGEEALEIGVATMLIV